jgi:hypothetical protein
VDVPAFQNQRKIDHRLIKTDLEKLASEHPNGANFLEKLTDPTYPINSYDASVFNFIHSFCPDNETIPGRLHDRSLTPHFLIIVDDTQTNQLIWDARRVEIPQSQQNPKVDFSEQAMMINTYLSATIPFGLGNSGPEIPLHYIFTNNIKAALLKCINLSLVMRMEKYSSFEPTTRCE